MNLWHQAFKFIPAGSTQAAESRDEHDIRFIILD